VKECARYEALIREKPIDIVCMGIGENGHIAFNDPPVADFNDEKYVKIVELEERDRVQQVNDAGFNSIEDVPKTAYTLTIPALMSARYLSVVVPGMRKAEAIKNTLTDDISTRCPATILRTHKAAKLFIDEDSASQLD
jgi:glucosamine-6-phosphate deaminase